MDVDLTHFVYFPSPFGSPACHRAAKTTISQNCLGYLCAHLALLQPPSLPSITLCSCCRSQHLPASRCTKCREFVMIFVLFLMGTPSTLLRKPTMHWSMTMVITPGRRCTLSTHGCIQEEALEGCSKKNQRPLRTCCAAQSMQWDT